MRRTIGAILIVLGLILFVNQVRLEIVSKYAYEKTYGNLWSLADKSSTIPAKQDYINKFVTVLKAGKEKGDFSDYNAMWLKTPDNQFDANLKALETLAGRLKEIQNMDPTSFQYNTAIQQITAQEQGEAHALMGVFSGCYFMASWFLVWGWVGAVMMIGSIVVFLVGILVAFWEEISDAFMF